MGEAANCERCPGGESWNESLGLNFLIWWREKKRFKTFAWGRKFNSIFAIVFMCNSNSLNDVSSKKEGRHKVVDYRKFDIFVRSIRRIRVYVWGIWNFCNTHSREFHCMYRENSLNQLKFISRNNSIFLLNFSWVKRDEWAKRWDTDKRQTIHRLKLIIRYITIVIKD